MRKQINEACQYAINKEILVYSSDLIICLDLDFNILEINPVAEKIYDWNVQKVLGKSFVTLCERYGYRSPLPERMSGFLEDKIALSVNTIIGAKWEVDWTLVPLDDTDNHTYAILLIGAKKDLEEGLDDAKALRKVIANLPAHVYWKDKDGVYRGCNDNFARTLNLHSSNEIIGNTDYDFLNKDKADRVFSADQTVIESRKKQVLEEEGIDSSGNACAFLSHKVPMFNDAGDISGVLGVSVDISQRKQFEERLKEEKELAEVLDKNTTRFLAEMNREVTGQEISENLSSAEHAQILRDYFETIISRMPGYVYWKDRKGVYLGCNDNLAHMIGLSSRADLIGKTDYEVSKISHWSRELAKSFRDADIKVMEDGKEVLDIEEIPFQHSDGSMIYELTSKVPLRNAQGVVIGVLGISIDISKRKKMEEELLKAKEIADQINEAKNQFIENMEHDLRTPCAGIAEMTSILHKTEKDGARKETLRHVATASQRLLEILNSILEFDHIESKKLPLTFSKFDVCDMIQGIVAMEYPSVNRKKLDLIIECGEDIPEVVIGDEFRVSRILINLMSNAVKFTKKGNVKVAVSLAKQIDNKNILLRFIVADTGIGIPKDKQQTIYERFSRVHPANKGAYKGSGLGLSIVKQFVEELNGEIDVDSKMGAGTTFECILPFELPLLHRKKGKQSQCINSKPGKKAIQKVESASKSSEKTKLKILLVEDDFLAQKIALVMLKERISDFIDIADTGKKAITLASKRQYDLIFMDVGLPDIDGYEVVRKLRGLKKSKNKDSIVVALTAHDNTVAQKDSMRAGMNNFIVKPLNENKVRTVLSEWFSEGAKSNRKVSHVFEEKGNSKVLDLKLGRRLAGGNVKLAEELLDMLIKDLPRDLSEINEAMQTEDIKELARLVHKLHGACCYCGTPCLKEAAKVLEQLTKSNNQVTAVMKSAHSALAEEIRAVLAAYAKHNK